MKVTARDVDTGEIINDIEVTVETQYYLTIHKDGYLTSKTTVIEDGDGAAEVNVVLLKDD